MSASDNLNAAIEAELSDRLNDLGFGLAESQDDWWGGVRTYRNDSAALEITYEIRDSMLEVKLATPSDDAAKPYAECLRESELPADDFEQACGGWDEDGLLSAKLCDALRTVSDTLPAVLANRNGQQFQEN